MPNPRGAAVGITLMLSGTAAALVAQENYRVEAYNQKEYTAKRFAVMVTEVRASLEAKRVAAEQAVIDRGKEKESIQEYLKVADKRISTAEAALRAAREEKATKTQRLSEMEQAIQDARDEAGKLIGDIQDKVQKQAEAEAKLEKATVAAEKARRSSWLPASWWSVR